MRRRRKENAAKVYEKEDSRQSACVTIAPTATYHLENSPRLGAGGGRRAGPVAKLPLVRLLVDIRELAEQGCQPNPRIGAANEGGANSVPPRAGQGLQAVQQDAGSAEDTQPLGQDMEENGALQKAAAHPFAFSFPWVGGAGGRLGGGASAVASLMAVCSTVCSTVQDAFHWAE